MTHPQPHPSPRRRRLLAGALALGLLLPAATAQASVPSTTITEPADRSAPFYDWLDGQGPYALVVAGTVGGTGSRDVVDIACVRRGQTPVPILENIPVLATARTFSAALDASIPALRTPCRLRALPSTKVPADLTPFVGPRLHPSGLRDFREQDLANPNVGILQDTDLNTVTPAGTSTAHLESFGGCGLWDARPLDPAVGPDVAARNVFECAGWADDIADFAPPTRSELQVDGRNAFTGAMAALSSSGLPGVPGRPALTRTATREAISGLLTLNESTDVVRCESQPPSYPFADPGACGSFVSTGVRFVREATMSRDGRVTTMRDTWESADGAEHSLDLLFEVAFASQQYGIQVPGQPPGLNGYAGSASIDGPATAPGTILVASNRAVPGGTLADPTGAVTFSSAPTSVEFVSGEDPSRYAELRYRRQIPAGGSLDLTHTFSMAPTAAESVGLGALAEDSYAGPALTIADPAAGATTTVPAITVRGTASDNRSLAGLTVLGAPVAVGADGTWSTKVTLVPGPNTIVARAADGAGNAAEASVAVTYDALAVTPCVVPALKGLRRLSSAKKLIARSRCAFGRVFSRYVRPTRIRKGMRTILVVTRRGTVLGTRQKTGARLGPKAKVDVVRQGRVPLTAAQKKALAKRRALAKRKAAATG